MELYRIYVGFDQLDDPKQRNYFQTMPTSFNLSREKVRDLIEIAGTLLEDSEDYHKLKDQIAKP